MAKRFSRLKFALKSIQSPTATATTTPNEPPADSILDKFKKFKTGATVVDYSRDATSKPGSFLSRGIFSFATGPGDENLYLVDISQRCVDEPLIKPVRDVLGYQTDLTTAKAAPRGFQPARVIIRYLGASAVTTTETSDITGVKYTSLGLVSYTLPYGSTVADNFEVARRAIITKAAEGIAAVRGISYLPERVPGK